MTYCSKKINIKFLKNIDVFDKPINLYYKENQNYHTYLGCLMTIAYGLIYFLFFLYKVVNMLKRTDVIFYDTYAYINEPQVINITNEVFYGGFALEDPSTYDPFIDETIYYPKAYFKTAKRNGSNWDWEVKNLNLEICKLENFGSFFRDTFKSKDLNTLYCFKDIEQSLIGHFSYDYYSFFYISFFPCINTTENNNHCKPIEQIDYYLKSTFISFQIQDIELTPLNFSYPVMPRDQDVYTTVGKNLFQEIHLYLQIVNIETDLEFLGLNYFYQVRTNKYLKFYSMNQMTNLIENNIYETGDSFCDVTIKLTDKVLTEKRRYTKLIEVLRDVGGFMEVMLSLFKIICYFYSNILYKVSLVNNLFAFDLDKKLILFQNKFIKINEFKNSNKEIKIFNKKKLEKKNFKNVIAINDDSSQSKTKLNNLEINDNDNIINSNILKNEKNLRRSYRKVKRVMKTKSFNRNIEHIKNKINKNISIEDKKNDLNNNYLHKEENEKDKRIIINKIFINKASLYCCFICLKRKKDMNIILLNEGMRILFQKLDIIYIFKKIFKDDVNITDKESFEMSDTCKIDLQKLKINNS